MDLSSPMPGAPVILTGSRHPALAAAIARALGAPLGECAIEHFPDGELHLTMLTPVRGRVVYLVQPTDAPVGEAVLELLLLADACRRAGARCLSAVVPYVGYARQDRRQREGEPLGIGVMAGLLAQGRFERLLVVDLHAPATEGCFASDVVPLSAARALVESLRPHCSDVSVVIAPDAGAFGMAQLFGQLLGLPVALVLKRRQSPRSVAVHELAGKVDGLRPIVVDDMISTGGTIAAALAAARSRGALPGATVVATHLLPGAGAAARLSQMGLDRIITSDSLPARDEWSLPVERVSLGPMLAEVIGRIERGESLAEWMGAR